MFSRWEIGKPPLEILKSLLKGFSIWGGGHGGIPPLKPEKYKIPSLHKDQNPPTLPNAQSLTFSYSFGNFSKFFRFRAILSDFVYPPPWTNIWNFGKPCLWHFPHFSETWHPPGIQASKIWLLPFIRGRGNYEFRDSPLFAPGTFRARAETYS